MKKKRMSIEEAESAEIISGNPLGGFVLHRIVGHGSGFSKIS